MERKNSYDFKPFNVRMKEYEPFYKIAKGWWEERKRSAPAVHTLSTTGIMVYHENYPVCAGWLYQTDSLMAVIGFVIGDLKTTGKVKKESVKFLLTKLEEMAKNMGFNSIFFPIETDSVARLGRKELKYSGSGKTNELAKIID